MFQFSNLRGCDGERVYFNGLSSITLNGKVKSKYQDISDINENDISEIPSTIETNILLLIIQAKPILIKISVNQAHNSNCYVSASFREFLTTNFLSVFDYGTLV